jgi:hypothetical protein
VHRAPRPVTPSDGWEWPGWKTTRSWPASCGTTSVLLDERVATIAAQLESGNDLTAHISLLSLESTSSMVGAKELASIAGLLRGAVERNQKHVVPTLVLAMTKEAARVHRQLRPAD